MAPVYEAERVGQPKEEEGETGSRFGSSLPESRRRRCYATLTSTLAFP